MRILGLLGALLIVAWLVLLLAVKITFAAVHVLVVLGVIMIIAAFFGGRASST